jgi:hypothetical protein
MTFPRPSNGFSLVEFLVDGIAETGSFRGGTTSLDFFVESEHRSGLPVATGRYTGRVVGRQPVFEQ